MSAVAHRTLRCQRRLRSVMSMRWRRRRVHMIMARVIIIGGNRIWSLKMIMLDRVRHGFGEGVADVVWNRLAGTVISAISNPTCQLHHRGSRRVIGNSGRLRHGIGLNLEHSWATRQHRLRHILRGRPLHARHLDNGGRLAGCHASPHQVAPWYPSWALATWPNIPLRGITTSRTRRMAEYWRAWRLSRCSG